jgi:hypothetical protein
MIYLELNDKLNILFWFKFSNRSKQVKLVFDNKTADLTRRIMSVKDQIIDLNKQMNSRNSSLVKDIAAAV